MPPATATSPPAGERPRGSWAEPTPPHPRPAATARTVAAGARPAAGAARFAGDATARTVTAGARTAAGAARFAGDATARTATAGAVPEAGETARFAGGGGRTHEAVRHTGRELGRGVLLAAGTVTIAAVAAMLAAFAFLVASGGDGLRVDHGTEAAWLLAAGFGLAAAAALVALAGTRPPTAALAALAPALAWLSGHPLPALLASVLVTGPAIALDRARPGRRVPAWAATALALAATACLAASFAAAVHAPRPPHVAAAAGAPRSRAHAGARHSAPRSHAHAAPAPPATPTPHAASSPAAAADPAPLVVAYYAALDARRFRVAWAVLAPAVRRDFGGFAHWRNGFATTISSRPRGIVAAARGRNLWDVRNVLVARDRTGCGARLTRRFAVRWRVARTAAGGWSVRSLSAVALGPAASPVPCR